MGRPGGCCALRERLLRTELAFAGFSLSEYAVWTAILVYAYERGGTTAAGLIAVVQLVPAAVVAPFAAAVADRRGGGYALVLGYALQALSMGATAVAMLATARRSSPMRSRSSPRRRSRSAVRPRRS